MELRYKRMLKGMRDKEKKASKKRKEKWFLYMLRCCDKSLYTGITNNLERRFKMHSQGKAARYTRTRLPVKMVYQETCKSRTEALIRECFVKSLSKPRKLSLINSTLLPVSYVEKGASVQC